MANLSITTAWNETSVIVRREAGLLLPIAFLLLALPSILFQLVVGFEPERIPEPGAWMLLLPVLGLVSLLGTLAICVLVLRPGVSVGEALSAGLRRLLPTFLATLLFGVIATLVAIPFVLVFGAGTLAVGGDPTNSPGLALLGFLLLMGVFIFVWTRIMLLTPVASAEPIGPIALLRRSWNLTRGHVLKLLGFVVLIVIAFLVISLAVTSIGGLLIALIAGRPTPGSLSMALVMLLGAVVNTLFMVYFTAMIARIYAQLAGDQVTPSATTNGI